MASLVRHHQSIDTGLGLPLHCTADEYSSIAREDNFLRIAKNSIHPLVIVIEDDRYDLTV